MALFNYATKEITLKIVYYGPGLSGKTTNLQYLHSILNPKTKGKLLSLSTESDRTLFFDFLPVELGKIRDFSIRFQLYTVPGQVRYNATRKVVLKGADAVVFVADSQKEMREQNIESYLNMRENLIANNIKADEIPVVLEYNKRDLKNIASIQEMDTDINQKAYPVIEASAVTGSGVEDAFKLITKLLLKYISAKHKIEIQPVSEKEDKAVLVPKEMILDMPVQEIDMPDIPSPEKQEVKPQEAVTVYTHKEEVQPASTPQIPSEPREAAIREKIISSIFPSPEKQEVKPQEAVTVYTHKEEVQPASTPQIPSESSETVVKENTVSAISDVQIRQVLSEIRKIQNAINDLNRTVTSIAGEIDGLKEFKQEQKETNDILREILDIFDAFRSKKKWFSF